MSRAGRRAVTALTAAGTALLLVAVIGSVVSGMSWSDVVSSYTLTNAVIGVGFLGSGALIAWSRPDNRLGWLFLVCGLGHLTTAAVAPLVYLGVDSGWPDPVVRTLATVYVAAWQIGIVGLFPLAVLLFPDGRLPSPRWRPVVWLIVAQMVAQIGVGVFSGEPAIAGRSVVSILATGQQPSDAVGAVLNAGNLATLMLPVLALVVRYRRGPEQVRRQVLWLILAVLALGVLNSQRWITGDGPILLLLTFVLVPVAIAIAVVRHQLLDIRLVVSRAVLYLLVSIALIAGYAGLVAGLSLVVPDDADRGIAALAALAVAFAFGPVRALLQGVVDRTFYGSRTDALAAAEDVARRLAPGADLDDVLEQARVTLRLPALTLVRDGAPVASAGELPSGGGRAEVALAEGTASAASLEVGLRRGEEELHPADRRVLALIGTPLALALHSADLAEQVQASRAALVGAHAEERLRLHRELHDGLGPVLTGAAFRADAASNVLHADADAADRLIGEVRAGVRQAIEAVRRVVYDLRPLELEEQGLVAALRQGSGGGSVEVVVEASDELGELPPAVEVAAFRIVSEAVNNVLRHSTATRCVVRLRREPSSLCLEVADDGADFRPWKPGVGLRSLMLRAEELGGRAVAGPTPAGGRVAAELPL